MKSGGLAAETRKCSISQCYDSRVYIDVIRRTDISRADKRMGLAEY